MVRRKSSQALWTEGEALDRAGRPREALDLYVRAAGTEEDAGQPLRARLLWERIAERYGASGLVLERLASTSGRAKLQADAFHYWMAAAAKHRADGRAAEAERALLHGKGLREQAGGAEAPPLAAKVLAEFGTRVEDLS